MRPADPVALACGAVPDGRVEIAQKDADLARSAHGKGVAQLRVSRVPRELRVARVWRVVDDHEEGEGGDAKANPAGPAANWSEIW